MDKHKLSKRYKTYYKFIGIIGLVLLSTSLLANIYVIFQGALDNTDREYKLFVYARILLNILSQIAFLIIILKPERCELLSIISLIYTLYILIADKINLIAVFMAILATVVLYMRGFFIKNKIKKIIGLIIIYISALSTEIRFGKKIFIEALLNNFAAFFISGIIFLFIKKYLTTIKNRYEPMILDLTKYDKLTDQDKTIIKLLKEGQKYDWIAGNLKIATSTLKKHIRRIFEILDVTDLVDFHAEFGGRKVIYTIDELLEWKKNFLSENY